MRRWLWQDTFNNVGVYESGNVVIHAVVSVILIYAACTVIDICRIKLLEAPLMKKLKQQEDTWYGMTYHEDVAAVKDSFKKTLEKGVYKADLFADL